MTARARGRRVVVSALPALSELTAAATNRSFPAGDVEALSRVLTDMAAGEPLPSTPSTHQMLPTWSGNAVRQAEIYKELHDFFGRYNGVSPMHRLKDIRARIYRDRDAEQ